MGTIVSKSITTVALSTEEVLEMLAANVEDFYIDVGTGTDFYIESYGDIKNLRIVDGGIELDISSN